MTTRRNDTNQWTGPELAIREAMLSIESLDADPRLTSAGVLLQQARELVADYVDGGGRMGTTASVRYLAVVGIGKLIGIGEPLNPPEVQAMMDKCCCHGACPRGQEEYRMLAGGTATA